MKYTTYLSAAAILALSTFVTGCGGGGAGTALPSSPHAGGPGAISPSSAKFSISFAAIGSKSSGRSPKYISANTQSISIAETDAGQPALTPVVINVANCPTSAGTTTCSATVPANPGTDTFAIATYDAQNATGNKLSSGSLTAAITAGQANVTVPVVLGGIVNSLKVTLGDAFAPLGTATTLSVAALDASGATIIGTYDNPLALSAAAGVTLSAATAANSTQASAVAVSYTGEPAAPIAITATGDGHTATATLTPGSGIAYYNVGTNLVYNNGGFEMTAGVDGKLYYSAIGACVVTNGLCRSSTGAIGQFDPVTHTFKEYDDTTSEVVGVYQTPDGAIWAAEQSTQKIARFAPGTFPSTPTEVSVPGGYWPRNFSLGPDGNLWYAAGGGTIAKININVPFTAAAVSYYYVPRATDPNTPRSYPFFNSFAWGTDGNLYATDQNNGQVDQISQSGVTLNRFTLPDQTAAGANFYIGARYITAASDGNLYVTEGSNTATYPVNGALEKMTTAGAFTKMSGPSSAYQFQPDAIAAGTSNVAWADLADSSFGTLNLSGPNAGSMRELPTSDYITNETAGLGVNGVAFSPDGTPWFTCYANSGVKPLCLGHVVLNNVWSVFPSRAINLYGVGQAAGEYMGIGETGDSSPFTITSANPAIAVASHISDHNFEIDGVAAGTTTLTVTDRNARSVTVTVNVTTTNGTVQSNKRKSGGIN